MKAYRLAALAGIIAAYACTSQTTESDGSKVNAVESGITNFDVFLNVVDIDRPEVVTGYQPESKIDLLNGHRYEIYAALYSKGISGFTDGSLLWLSSSTLPKCAPVRTPRLTASDAQMTIPLCEVSPERNFTVDGNSIATITIDRDAKSRGTVTPPSTGSDSRARAALLSVCRPSAIINRLPSAQASLASQVQASATGGSCTCGGWTISLDVFKNEFLNKGVDYAQACADELAKNAPSQPQVDARALFQQECRPDTVSRFLPESSSFLANQVRSAGDSCSCGGWTIALSVFKSEYLDKGKSYARDCADELAKSQSSSSSDPVRLAFENSCRPEVVAGLLPSRLSGEASRVGLVANGERCACGGWEISQGVFRDEYLNKGKSYPQACADELARQDGE